MKFEIKDVTKDIVRVTTQDERWYIKPVKGEDGLPQIAYLPSITWIASCYPKGTEFYKWLASTGWDEAKAIKESAGARGSKVHAAVEILLKEGEFSFTDTVTNPNTGEQEQLNSDEYECVMNFLAWYKETNPEILAVEEVFFNKEMGYAGTIDIRCKINGKPCIVDLKTSKDIRKDYIIQLTGHKLAYDTPKVEHDIYVLQVGYRRNKKGFKMTEIEFNPGMFEIAYSIWKQEHDGERPLQREFPTKLSLA